MLSSRDPTAGLRQAPHAKCAPGACPCAQLGIKLLGNLQARHSGSSSIPQLPCSPCSVIPQRSCEPASLTGALMSYIPSVNKGFRKQGTSTRALVTITPPKGEAAKGRCPDSQKCCFQKLAMAALELAQAP